MHTISIRSQNNIKYAQENKCARAAAAAAAATEERSNSKVLICCSAMPYE